MDGYDPDLDYKAEVDKMLLAMRFLADVNTIAILATIEAAHTIGPFMDPTKYRDALNRGDLDQVAELARELQGPLRVWRERFAGIVAEVRG